MSLFKTKAPLKVTVPRNLVPEEDGGAEFEISLETVVIQCGNRQITVTQHKGEVTEVSITEKAGYSKVKTIAKVLV